MKRDKKLILKILRYVRDNATDVGPIDPPDCRSHYAETVLYHVKLCVQAGWIEPFSEKNFRGVIRIRSLTWHGHEYLEANCDCD